MSDNTTLNPGTGGDVVRTVDRVSAKTQVVGLDFGGDTGAGQEQLVTINNPLPVTDLQGAEAQAPDNPYFIATTGNPNGDFAFVDLLEELIHGVNNLSLAMRIVGADGKQVNTSSDGSGSMMVQANVRNYSGMVRSTTDNGGVLFTAPCADMMSIQLTAQSLVSGTIVVEVWAISGWQPLVISSYTPSGTATGQSMGVTAGSYNFLSGGLAGATQMRVRASAVGAAGWVSVSAKLLSCPPVQPMPVTQAVQTGSWSVTTLNGGSIAVGAAQTNNPNVVGGVDSGGKVRNLLTDAVSGGVVLSSASVGNGQTIYKVAQTVTTPAATVLKATAGRLTMLNVTNGAAVAGFLHIYNATSVTLGTTSDVMTVPLPAAAANYPIKLPDGGLYFSTGICMAFTAAVAATDNTVFGSAPTLIANGAFI